MTPTARNLFLAPLAIVSLTLTLGACSFKKDPEKDKVQVKLVEKIVAPAVEVDLYDKVKSTDVKDLITEFDDVPVAQLEKLQAKNGMNLIDIAIDQQKMDLLSYLLKRGFNPFLYSDATYARIALRDDLKELISSFQRPMFNKILRETDLGNPEVDLIPDPTSNSISFNKYISDLGVKAPGCVILVESILNQHFYYRTTSDSQMIAYPAERVLDGDIAPVIKKIINSPSCTGIKNYIPSVTLTNWFSEELVFQLRKGFPFQDLLLLLETLGPIKNLSVDIYTSQGKKHIDPRAVILIKTDWTKETKPSKKDWLVLVNKHISKEPYFYNIEYSSYPGVGGYPKALQCADDDPLCAPTEDESIISPSDLEEPAKALGLDTGALEKAFEEQADDGGTP